jgi:hypothetical protein
MGDSKDASPKQAALDYLWKREYLIAVVAA